MIGLFLLDMVLGGIFIWLSMGNMDGGGPIDPNSDAGELLQIYRDLSAAFYGGYLAGVMYCTFYAVQYLRQQSRSDSDRSISRTWICPLTITFLL